MYLSNAPLKVTLQNQIHNIYFFLETGTNFLIPNMILELLLLEIYRLNKFCALIAKISLAADSMI